MSEGIDSKNKNIAISKDIRSFKTLSDVAQFVKEDKIEILATAYRQLFNYTRALEEQNKNRTELALVNETKYKTILENMSLGLLEVDMNHIILKPYDTFCQMTGYTAEEIIGKNARTLFIPEESLKILDDQNDIRKDGKATVYEVEFLKKDGTRIWVLISGVPIFDEEGTVIGSMGIHYDMSESKQLQKDLEEAKSMAEAAQRAEQQFLANMSHEIRTPLNAIIGMSHLLYDTNLNQVQKDYLEVLKSSADILKGLISDILDFSKISSGSYELNEKAFNLKNLVNSIHKTFELDVLDRPISMRSHIDPKVKTNIIGDELLLNQVCFNLLGNAIKFTKEGEIGLSIKLQEEKDKLQKLIFCVFDTGIGMNEEEQSQIFQTYKQAKSHNNMLYGGTGLGLAISKQIVELQGGEIWVESNTGMGTKFYFTLAYPLAKSTDTPIAAIENIPQPSPSNSTLLVVEDNDMNRKYISTLLRKWNYEFDVVVNGLQALDWAQKRPYDLILMDIQMPVLDGYEVTRRIRNSSNLNAQTPIIALTASALIQEKEKAINCGMTGFLPKPFTPKQLYTEIQPYLGKKEKPQQWPTNFGYLSELYLGDTSYAREMFELFVEYAFNDIQALIEGGKAAAWTQLPILIHKIKPSLAMVGYPELSEQLEAMNNAIENKEWATVKTLFIAFENAIIYVKPQIVKHLELLKSEDSDLFFKTPSL